MELGQKIKQLRFKAGLTQEQLAQSLGVTPQSVSKWENAASMPDITLLPALAGEFGVSIDDLFDLSAEQKLQRIENRMALESELPGDLFLDYAEYLKEQLNAFPDRGRILGLLARLYHHRMEADAAKVSRYAREAIRLAPGVKDCQWLLQLAEGHQAWDWNCSNHTRAIEFYKGLIMESEEAEETGMMTQDSMNALVPEKLREIERECGVKVLYSAETGSRAWGLATPDSDFDVRFIYIRPRNDYLRLDEPRDVIETPVDDTWDVSGWDLQKALRLLWK